MFTAGQQITVKRTSGIMESDWYCWTDFNRTDGSAGPYTAPEAIAVLVVKPVEGASIEDVRNGEAKHYEKHVPLIDLIEWNRA